MLLLFITSNDSFCVLKFYTEDIDLPYLPPYFVLISYNISVDVSSAQDCTQVTIRWKLDVNQSLPDSVIGQVAQNLGDAQVTYQGVQVDLSVEPCIGGGKNFSVVSPNWIRLVPG